MSREFLLKSAIYGGRSYSSASVLVDEKERRIELSYERRSFTKKEKVPLGVISFDERSEVSVEGQKVALGDTTMEATSEGDALALAEVLRRPFQIAVGAMHDALTGPVARFLDARAETLSLFGDLARDYRKTVLEHEKLVPPEAKDPLAEIESSKLQELENLLGTALSSLQGLLAGKTPVNERPYAFIYGVCSLQDAKFSGQGLDTALGTLSGLGLRPSDRMGGSSIPDATRELEVLVASQPQLLI